MKQERCRAFHCLGEDSRQPKHLRWAAQLIDTAWSVALHRAQQAGRLLAHVLAAGAHGDRPVTLVGNSMGARLIFHCLLELSRLKAKGAWPP